MTNVLRQVKNGFRPLYWRIRFSVLSPQWIRSQVVARKLKHRLEATPCSVCGSTETFRITFFIEHQIDKCFCKGCGHIFSRKLNHDLQRAAQLFTYDRPNEQYDGQKRLQLELIRSASRSTGTYLDFGVGGNIEIANDLRRMYPQHQFHACDLYSSNARDYFQIYSPASPLRRFDGISSNAVVEHLDNTLEAWRYLNRLLKPMAEGGGMMVHAFPSQIVEDPNHWAIRIASHECLFSRKSLELACRHSGFAFIRIRYFASVQHPVYYFRKTRDCE